MEPRVKNGFLPNLINSVTFQLTRLVFKPYRSHHAAPSVPLLVSGIFRSGTSITTLILSEAGFDPGRASHLIPARGRFQSMNPDGFMENFFFMELSMYLFHVTGSAGDQPPATADVEQIQLADLNDDDLRFHSLLRTHDDRVSNMNKMRVLRRASVHDIAGYMQAMFSGPPILKNPHFSVLEPFFRKIFPQSKRVVVFRDPEHWQVSVKMVTPNASFFLYDQYYQYYLEQTGPEVIFFNYDRLLQEPKSSISALLSALNLPVMGAANLAKLVRKKEPTAKTAFTGTLPTSYPKMLGRAVNR